MIKSRLVNKRDGFTIVELLIVIVVIGVLAAIVINSFSYIQKLARDNRRLADITDIRKALSAYKAANGTFPDATPSSAGAWDASSDTTSGHVFIANLKSSGFMPDIPNDPINVSNDSNNNTGQHYNYYTYSNLAYLSSIGCSTTRGKLTVLMVTKLEVSAGVPANSPGFSCASRNFNNEGDWVWGEYDQ